MSLVGGITVEGDSNNNILTGTDPDGFFYYGQDSLYGYEGDDSLYSYGGDDDLIGGSGNDYLDGGSENDVLTGSNPSVWNSGSGEYDTLVGGSGADTFVLGDSFEAYYQGSGYALITDFNWTEGDQLRAYGSSSNYSFSHVDWFGGSATDTVIYYNNDLVAVLQDAYTSSSYINTDFTFV